MDIFRYRNPNHKTKMESGQLINGLESKTWIERYRKEGEFTFTAPVYTGMKDLLPIGSFISHVNTGEIMQVENHEITDNRGEDSELTLTGRTFETVTENRIVGSNNLFPISHDITDISLYPEKSWKQIVHLIQNHIYASEMWDDNNSIPHVSVFWSGLSDNDSDIEELRQLSRGTVYEHVLDLLEVDNLGIKIIRPGANSYLDFWWDSPNTAIVVHKGVNRTGSVVFSNAAGQIESANYLWSNKPKKNAALISGKWVEVFIHGPEKEIDRRVMFVSASDIDDTQEVPPTGMALSWIVVAMKERGKKALAAQNDVVLTQAEVSKDTVKPRYRFDYGLGDIVTVEGDYNTSAAMRVTEHVEIEDKSGHVEYPILELDPPEEI